MGKMKNLSRIVYGLVGVSSLFALYFMFSGWSNFWSTMGTMSAIAFILLTIGGLNWGIVAISGNRDNDLFGFLGF